MSERKIRVSHYYTLYPECRVKGRLFTIRYRVLSRRYELFQNGVLYGRYLHSDLALLEILRLTAGLIGDELPPKFEPLMKTLEKRFLIRYEGLESDNS